MILNIRLVLFVTIFQENSFYIPNSVFNYSEEQYLLRLSQRPLVDNGSASRKVVYAMY